MLKMQVIGHLGRDAEVNTVSGHTVINFNVCHTEKFKDSQGNAKEKSTWVQCAYWTDKTGIAPYLKKGTQVYAEGQPEAKSYPKNDGTTGVNLILRIGMVQLLSSANQQATGYGTQDLPPNAATRQPAQQMTQPVDDLPF